MPWWGWTILGVAVYVPIWRVSFRTMWEEEISADWGAFWGCACIATLVKQWRRAERAEAAARDFAKALRELVDTHHRTLTGSKLHAPDMLETDECPAHTCQKILAVLAAHPDFAEPAARPQGQSLDGLSPRSQEPTPPSPESS